MCSWKQANKKHGVGRIDTKVCLPLLQHLDHGCWCHRWQAQPVSETWTLSVPGAEILHSTAYSSSCESTENADAAYGEINTSSSILFIVRLRSSLVLYQSRFLNAHIVFLFRNLWCGNSRGCNLDFVLPFFSPSLLHQWESSHAFCYMWIEATYGDWSSPWHLGVGQLQLRLPVPISACLGGKCPRGGG